MKVAVQLFAAARELAGEAALTVETSANASVAQLRAAIVAQAPRLMLIAERSLIAVNSEYANESTLICEADEVALIPPVSGG